MRRRLNLAPAVVAALAAVAAVLVPAAAPATTHHTPSTRIVTPRNDGQRVSVARFGRLTISLKDNNPSTGYAWRFERKPSTRVLRLISDTTRRSPSSPPLAGAPEPRTIVYRAVGRGATRIRLSYRRSYGPAADRLAVTVRVR